MTTVVRSQPYSRNPLPQGQLPYSNQFNQHQNMVNAINQHHQHNQQLHQLHGLQKQVQQPHCATPMQAKYDAEEERQEPDHADLSVCVHIVMTVKSEWIHEVKFLIQRIKKWAEAHEPGLLTFRATVDVDNPCEIRLFQEYSNLDAYRVHETNPFMQEMVNGLADYLEEDMEFFESQEFAL